MSNSKFVFVSSSSDLAQSRKRISSSLSDWLEKHGMANAMALYFWDEDTDGGHLLSDRMPIQAQIPDPLDADVPFTLCLFGERCGVPLQDEIPADWERRIKPWRCGADGRGLVHPWPTTEEDQWHVLKRGGFPLTGTVFELISACSVDPDHDNLVIGYIANRYIGRTTTVDDLYFNENKEESRLRSEAKNRREAQEILDRDYWPQVSALLNLLKYFEQNVGNLNCYARESDLTRDVIQRAQDKLRRHLGLTSSRNPFKATLEHWSIDDERSLPGRADLIKTVLRSVYAAKDKPQRSFVILKGRSGCGKSSLLQRGILARLQEDGALVLALRPTDLEEPSGERDQLDLLWSTICSLVDGCSTDSIARHRRYVTMANRLVDALDACGARLVIGLDQFEEILDELALSRKKRQQSRGWSHVMRFLASLSKCPQVQLIATLESSRSKTFEALDIEKDLGLQRETYNADASADDVAQIAMHGFSSSGLTLDRPLVEEIKTKWEKFEAEHAGDVRSASPLPLVCLWLARVFDRFEDRAQVDVRVSDETQSAWTQASDSQVVTLDDLGGPDEVAFENTIAELAEEAWLHSGEAAIADKPIEENPQEFSTLANFLQPMVGLDDDGHMRLLTVPESATDDYTNRLRESFRQLRLLVPAGESTSAADAEHEPGLRLVHQSVIDRWMPARRWFDWSQNYLKTENRVYLEAKRWVINGCRKPRATVKRIQEAAQVLHQQRIDWPGKPDKALDKADRTTRAYCLALFEQSKEPLTIVETSIYGNTYAHLAAAYGLTGLIKKFVDLDDACLHVVNNRHDTLISSAAWFDGPMVSMLLDLNAPACVRNETWHPISTAILIGSMDNYHALLRDIDDLDQPVGPVGITMLHWAARSGNCAVIEDLLSRGVDSRKQDEGGRDALVWAAWHGGVDAFLRMLPVSDITASTGDEYNVIALGYAAELGHAAVIRAALDSEVIDEADLDSALAHRSGRGYTLLMVAALFKRTDALKELLGVCDPTSAEHIREDGNTVLHLAVTRFSAGKVFDDEKLRARRTVELLVEDGRVDLQALNNEGKTAFELANSYEEARRVLRRHMPLDYDLMSPSMRAIELEAHSLADALRLIRAAPQSLSDRHGELTGVEILVRGKKTKVLAVAIEDSLMDDSLLKENLEDIASVATGKQGGELRSALVTRLASLPDCHDILPTLLDSALRDQEEDIIETLFELGVSQVRGAGKVRTSMFHDLAVSDDRDEFERLAEKYSLAVPIDDWGRRPSDMAVPAKTSDYRQMEERLFEVADASSHVEVRVATKFHDYALKGDVKLFERQARGSSIPVPVDEKGRKPSDVADEDHREAIAALEATLFEAVN